MKQTDKQRMKKILDFGEKLLQYLNEQNISKDDLPQFIDKAKEIYSAL